MQACGEQGQGTGGGCQGASDHTDLELVPTPQDGPQLAWLVPSPRSLVTVTLEHSRLPTWAPVPLKACPLGRPSAGCPRGQVSSYSGCPAPVGPSALGEDSGGQTPQAHLEVDELGFAVEGLTLECMPRRHLLVDYPAGQLLHGAGQDILVHLCPTHRFLVHVLFGHLGFRGDSGHWRAGLGRRGTVLCSQGQRGVAEGAARSSRLRGR